MTVDDLTKREQPGMALLPYDPITTLRFLGRDAPTVELPVDELRFTIGSGVACDAAIPQKHASAVSTIHASLDRIGNGLLVRDLGSKNGTFASLRGPRCEVLLVHPGETFWVANVAVRVTDRYLDTLRSHLTCHLGILRDAAIDEAVENVAAGEPLLLVGPPGTGAQRLAAVIHATSPQRANPRIMGMAPPCVLGHAQGSTLFIDLDKVTKVSAPYLATLFDRTRGLRVIFAASSEQRARARLDHYRERVRAIELVPLARRREDVPHLMQFHWATELATKASVTAMGPRAIEALQAYDWPHNLDELFAHSRRILAYLEHGGLRPAAATLGITHQTLAGHLARIDFPVLDQAEREVPLRSPRGCGGASAER